MKHDEIKIPAGQRLIATCERSSGVGAALVQISHQLYAVYSVLPSGHMEDPEYSSRIRAGMIFERRKLGYSLTIKGRAT